MRAKVGEIAVRRRWPRMLVGLLVIVLLVLFGLWRDASSHGGQKPVEPFRIAGNLYYVGSNDVAAFLLTGEKGHVLIDGGYPGSASLIMASIARLGFRITDVRLLLNSHAHFDHAGGLAELKEASGAQLWISEGDADAVESGGARDLSLGPMRYLAVTGLISYPPARVDRRFTDGTVVRVGSIKLTAHIMPGHTRGSTTWSFPVRDKGRTFTVVDMCDMDVFPFVSLVEPEQYPGVRADYERSFEKLREMDGDIFLASHARQFGRWRKLQARAMAADPVQPFIDRSDYESTLDHKEAKFRQQLALQQRGIIAEQSGK